LGGSRVDLSRQKLGGWSWEKLYLTEPRTAIAALLGRKN